MSSIDKLSIQGIRSFSPEKSETIAFGSPLTLICGQNGCGKTTIIECLKYATTGLLPPNSKGGAFINDPNISKKSLINGQIKLSIISCDKQRMIITRSMQLMKRGKDKTTFKTLENQLSKFNKREKIDMLSKNSDLDNEMPNILGTSKAILDYVIFCHQDESLWPLSEPSQLKKKFDDIFQASKFTKVLDNLKLINKDLSVDIKLLEKSVEHLKIDKTRANKIFNNLEDLKQKIDVLNEEIGNLTLDITKHEQELEELYNSNQDFQKILSQYDQLKFTEISISQQLSRLESSIAILPDSLDELNDKLNNFNGILEEYSNKVAEILKENTSLNQSIDRKRSEMNELNKVQGSLNFKQNQYHENISQINKLADSASDMHNYKKELETSVETVTEVYEDTKAANDKERSERNSKLQSTIGEINNQNSIKGFKLESIEELKSKVNDLKNKIKSLNLDEANLNNERAELATLNDKYSDTKNSKFVSNLKEEISKNTDSLNQLELEYENLGKKIQLYNNQNDLINKISYVKQSKSNIQLGQSQDFKKLQTVLGDDKIAEENYKSGFENACKKAEKDYKELKAAYDKSVSEENSMVTSIDLTSKKLIELRKELETCDAKILKVLAKDEIKDYNKILQDLEMDYQNTVESLKTFEISKQFKIKAIEIGKKSHNCTLCQRPFNDQELTGFIKLLQEDVNKMSIDQLNTEVEEAKRDYELMKSINSDIYSYESLNKEINELGSKKTQLEHEHTNIKSLQLKEISEKFNNQQQRLNEINSVKYLLDEISASQNQIEAVDNKINSLTMELDDFDVNEEFSIDELNKTQSDKLLELKNLRTKINNSKDMKDKKEREMYKLSNAIKDKEILIKNLESDLSDFKNSQDLMNEYNKSISRLTEEIQSIDEKLNDMKVEKEKQVKENDEIFEKMLEDEDKRLADLDTLRSKQALLQKLLNLIEEFENSDKHLIDENSQKINVLGEEIRQLNDLVMVNNSKLKDFETKLHESSNLKSAIRDNIDYKNLQEELSSIEQQISHLNIHQAEENRDRYQKESKDLRAAISDLNAENSSKIGQVKQINEQIKSLKQELNEEYKDIDDTYYGKWIELQTNLLISNDLVTYSKSVDKAIMEFHSIKMKEINKILRELWVATYKGTDIDYIAIKSDTNDQSKTTSNTNRSYNYRVVMYKFGTELDMRGRCSAGQKVLTSILIRLALAECFGSNCGIIALDEPTTNLDLENTESLAESLNKIIEFRKDQKNFQLIVITHDEKFLSLINGDSFTDSFFKIERDENQFSVIKNLPIYYIQDE